MKLIYAYIKHFRNIDNQEIYFSSGYKVTYNPSLSFPNSLTITSANKNTVSDIIYQYSKLSNVHVIVGKTGAGKTNIFQMIGMPENERVEEKNASYFLVYSLADSFVLEPFNISVDESVSQKHNRSDIYNKYAEEDKAFPAYVHEYMRLRGSMHMYKFHLDKCGKPINVHRLYYSSELEADNTFIFNGFERFAFPFCPYDKTRLENVDTSTIWQTRINAEYHKTALWSSCRFLKEYIDSFDKDSVKRKAALVIKVQNWSDSIKQHIGDRLEKHDYWTFRANIRRDDLDKVLGKKIKRRKRPPIRYQFVHDLLTDYALYLRKWIAYIQKWPDEVDEDNLDSSGTVDVYQESIDYWYEKELEERVEVTGKKDKEPIDPTVLPDFEKISINKRIEWLSMWIDRRGDKTPCSLLWQIYGDIKDIGDILGKFSDKYFTNDTFTLPIDEMYTERNKKLVEDLFERMEQYRPDDTGIFKEELLPYHFSCISSGEYQYAKVLGGIEEYCVKLSVNNSHPHLIYLLDEPETYMHPELCRNFMMRLDEILKERVGKADIQIIISTHSPLLLSDVLPEQITRLDMDSKGYCLIKNDTQKAYFGANIHTILADGFFLDYTIGEYARAYLQEKLDWIKKLLNEETISPRDIETARKLRMVVPFIGDSIIRKSFDIFLGQVEQRYGQN